MCAGRLREDLAVVNLTFKCKVLSNSFVEAVTDASPLKQPSAWLPIAMSLAGLGLVLLHVARCGITHDTDEGTSAHLVQILMVLQVPIVLYFAVKWLPRAPSAAVGVLALQAVAMAAAFAAVFIMESL